MSENVSKAYTYMTSENKKNYDEGWELIFGKKKRKLQRQLHEINRFISIACMGFIKHHPILKEWLEQVVAKFKGDDNLIFQAGMELFTHIAYRYRNANTNVVLSPDYFVPYNHQSDKVNVTSNTVVYHHFLKSWIS